MRHHRRRRGDSGQLECHAECVAPSTGHTLTFTVFDGTATTITCPIANTNTTCSDTLHTAAIAAGDKVAVQVTETGAGSSATVRRSHSPSGRPRPWRAHIRTSGG